MSVPPTSNANEESPSAVALLLIDVINDLDFPESGDLLELARPMAQRIAELRSRADAEGIPVIYANDNFGRWRSDFQAQIDHCLNDNVPGKFLTELLRPQPHHYFVLKPRHSAFYCTPLDLLLQQLGVDTLILTGLAGNICVLFTAHDAYLREFHLVIPADCLASNTRELNAQSLQQMQSILKAEIGPAATLTSERLRQLARKTPRAQKGAVIPPAQRQAR